MKTIEFLQPTAEIAELLDQAGDDDLIVRLADGREFFLIAIDDFDEEVAKSRNNPKLMALLKARASRLETVPLDEVKRRLGL